MKKFMFILFAGLIILSQVSAQDLSGVDGKKAFKQANKLLTKYELDQQNNAESLTEAVNYIKHAAQHEDTKDDFKTWRLMGDIYNAITESETSKKILDPNYEMQHTDVGLLAFDAYKKALELSPGDSKSTQGLLGSITSISELGFNLYESQNYEGAYNAFKSVLDIHDVLKANNSESPLDVESEYQNQLYITGMAALNAGKDEAAKANLQPLYDASYEKAGVYEALHKIAINEGNEEKAEEVLQKGRETFPEDLGMLYAEINYFLQKGRIEVLDDKLKMAIEKDPENASLYSTLGNVHDKLYQNDAAAGNTEAANEHFALAKSYYEQALEVDPEFVTAIYSIGALYYNKAAAYTQELNELASDYSKEGTEKYNAKKAQIDEIFEIALPFFQKVEKLDPNDRNALIALKEIYARSNELEVSNEFKQRLDKIEAGEKIEMSYFKNQQN